MTNREKLIELIADKSDWKAKRCIGCEKGLPEAEDCKKDRFGGIADHLLDNGVTFAADTNNGGKWISVEDRLPENGVWVMAYQDCGWIGVAQIEEDGWHWYTQDLVKLSDPTHWMPLPEPPKEN